MKYVKIILSAAARGALSGTVFMSFWFAAIVLSWVMREGDLFAALGLGALSGSLIGLALFKNSLPQFLLSALFAAGAVILLWLAVRQFNLLEWALNVVDPGYGWLSAGGKFGLMFTSCFYLLMCACFFPLGLIIRFIRVCVYKKTNAAL